MASKYTEKVSCTLCNSRR